MLESISIKNFALIDEASIEFSEGFNVLTGETGAGKSIIIDSLIFALGEKTGRGLIRSGEALGSVEAVFRIDDSQAASAVKNLGVELDDDAVIVIYRTLSEAGKSTARVNGQTVTASTLKKITAELIDIHGQHEHQSLLDQSKQLDFVDSFCGDALFSEKAMLETEFKNYRRIKAEIDKLKQNESDKESRLEFLDFRIEELEAARLKEGEDESLLEEKKSVLSADKLITATGTALELLYDGSESKPALDSVSEALRRIEDVADLDKRIEPYIGRLYEIREEIADVSTELRRYFKSIEQDPARIDEIEERLNELYLIKRKYGGTISGAISSLKKMLDERETLNNSTFELDKLNRMMDESKEAVHKLCGRISAIRKESAEKMERLITDALRDLSMADAVFSVSIDRASLSPDGWDSVEIMLSANKGEALKPLAKIASGGEMSRVMLAIKSIAASQGSIGTFIFDEIDTGVSGRAAQRVAEKMAVLAAKKQLICITHLPQIAAMADKHMLIEKSTSKGSTLTSITDLDEDSITLELSRLLGGAKITEQTRLAAAEMRELAKLTKLTLL